MNNKIQIIALALTIMVLGVTGGVIGIRFGMKPSPDAAGHRADSSRPEHHDHESGATVTDLWKQLEEGNERFVEGSLAHHELVGTRRELAQGQHPRVIVVGCSDSRVSPELIFDQSLGDLFTIRTAGNVADPVALGSIEYAVEHLHSPMLVILGHEKCGAVAAAASGEKMPTRNLAAIVGKIGPALAKVKANGKDPGGRQGVVANVEQSARDIVATSPIVRAEFEAGKLEIVKAVYHLETGKVDRLH